MERKLATVLFVDLVGSTELVATVDPEIVRRRVTRFFEQVSHCVTTHGGIVEKFAGDAVMAAFGIPQAHEDDAERGVRAALTILDSMHELGLETRIGVESGQIVADESESTFATGGAVNFAARLQQAAGPGQILMGPFARRLTLGKVEADECAGLELKGFDGVLSAWLVTGAVEAGAQPATLSARFVGREEELDLLENTLKRVVRGERAHLFTIYGEPGVGKSRLAQEFLAGVEGATILVGRSLPYGEAITYWPLAEMVKTAAGITDDDPVQQAISKLRLACGDDAVADLLALASGVLEAVAGSRSAQEIAWAAREWAEQLASAQPLVLVFEDIHWAEDPLLELIEHLAERVRDEPLMIICLARPELLDLRPGWGGGRLRATAIELEPLAPSESQELVDGLLGDRELGPAELRALLEKTEGNPLFLEETIRMLLEEGSVATKIPDTVQALIAARIDRLPRREKALLQRGAVMGRVFWDGALQTLSPDMDDVAPVLDDLLQRDFVTLESRTTITGQDAYRFKHVLIRDVAYAGLSKWARAGLHERFAEWLQERTGDELLEIRAYHLDQAAALHAELDGRVPDQLSRAAAFALEAAGRRALAREANRAARKLLRRSVDLEPTLERRYQAARAAWRVGDLPAVSVEMEEVRLAAAGTGDRVLEARALTALAEVSLLRDADLPHARELVEQALELLDGAPAEDRFDALTARARIGWWLGDVDDDERYILLALAVAQEAGRLDLEASATEDLASVAIARLDLDRAEELVVRARELASESGNIVARGWSLLTQGRIDSMRGRIDDSEAALTEALELLTEAGADWARARALNAAARLSRQRGDNETAERRFRDAIRILQGLEDRGTLCESQRGLAQTLVLLGRLEEAERFALEARRTVGPHDMASRATTRMALGLVWAAQGRDDEAEPLLREALALVDHTKVTNVKAEVASGLAEFLRSRGRVAEANELEGRLPGVYAPAAFA